MYSPLSDFNIRLIETGASKICAKRTSPKAHWMNHYAMVKCTTVTLKAMVDAKLTVPIDNIHEQSTFRTLWHLQHHIVDSLRKLGNIKHPLRGHVGYIL